MRTFLIIFAVLAILATLMVLALCKAAARADRDMERHLEQVGKVAGPDEPGMALDSGEFIPAADLNRGI
jgi:hypothetical protein